ncbi:MAG TPA: helix-turn-helix domain-containing protein [Candidatus Limnocylindria bacterium]
MKVGDLRERLAAAMASAMRRPEPEAVALTADRAKAMAVAMAGMDPSAEVDPEALVVGTRQAAVILGFHPEHVRRLIRTGRLRAALAGGDYQILVNDLWPLLEVRYRQPGRRRLTIRRP